MAQLQAGQIVVYVRAQGRITQQYVNDPALLMYISQAQKDVAMEVRRPGATWTFTTAPLVNPGTLPEYRIKPFVDVKRVKLNGLLLVPTRIPDLEGAQIQLWDTTSTNYGTQWENATMQTYPPAGSGGATLGGYPQPTTLPWVVGARPEYYLRDDAQIGFVPPPVQPAVASMDVIKMPSPLTSLGDYSDFDDMFLDLIGWRTIQKVHAADAQDPQHLARSQDAQQNYRGALATMWTQLRMNNSGNPSGLVPVGIRNTGNQAPATYPLIPGE